MLLGVQHYGFARAYFNNIVITSRIFDKHIQHVYDVLEAITDSQFNINTNKLTLFAKKLRTLRFVLSGTVIQLDPEKINAIKNFSVL